MLPEVGASELLVIAIVALIVVGPKDLPLLLRRFGQFMAKLRGMAAEFRSSFDEMARQSELDDLRKEVEAMRRGEFGGVSAHAADTEMRSTVHDIEQSLADVGVQLHPPMSYQYDTMSPSPEPIPAVDAAGAPPPVTIGEGPAPPARKPRARKSATAAPADPEAVPPRPRRRASKASEA